MELTSTKKLRGTVTVPGDKSISHRAVMFGAIANGLTEIHGFLQGADCLATINCFAQMGIEIENLGDTVLVHGRGLHGLCRPSAALDTKNSGTTTRLLSGILAGQPFETTVSGDASLNTRPMGRIITPLSMMGADITSLAGNGCAPLRIRPSDLHGISYSSGIASAQVKSAILLAGLYADRETSVTEPELSRDHTERMLRAFGADLKSKKSDDGAVSVIRPCKELFGQKVLVPGDISSATYFIAAGLLVPDSEIVIRNVGVNPTRAGILSVCEAMGADITYLSKTDDGGEPTADLLVRTSSLHGTVIEGSLIPTLIDEIPMLAILAACAEGTTIIRDAQELKVKETNRIDTVTENLKRMGADITPTDDGMIIHGKTPLHGAVIDSYFDHRIAMAFSIAALIADGTTIIQNSSCVDVSFPDFYSTLRSLKEEYSYETR